MEERIERRKKREVNSKKIDVLKLISRVFIVLLTVLIVTLFTMVIKLKVLPMKFLIPLGIVLIGLDLFGAYILLFRKNISKKIRLILTVISCILLIVFGFITSKIGKMMNFLGAMSTETVNTKTYAVLVLKDSKFEKLEDIQYKMIKYYDTELGSNKEAIEKVKNAITVVAEETNDIHDLANSLINGEADAILIEDSNYIIIEEKIADFKDKVREIYTFTLEDKIETIAKEAKVTDEPFVIYISGIDTYGKISSVSRSDVNMIAVINPKTKQVLLINTPRDYYVKLHSTSGYRDKLTHAGIYGIDMSVKTLEDLYSTDINYYVRVNFSSLIKIIDAIGGVDVYSKYAFTSRIGGYHFVKGTNHLTGKKALGFARERYSFSEGDRMRGQNQQAVIEAMIKKVTSSTTILTKFDKLLDSLKGSFQTNMDTSKILDLVRMQISDGASWNVTSISVDGLGSSERTYSMGKTLLYVMIPYSGSVNKASSMIKQVLNGEILEKGVIDLSSYNDFPVVSKGVYPKDTTTEKKKETTKTDDENQNTEDPTLVDPTEPDPTTVDPTPVDPNPVDPYED